VYELYCITSLIALDGNVTRDCYCRSDVDVKHLVSTPRVIIHQTAFPTTSTTLFEVGVPSMSVATIQPPAPAPSSSLETTPNAFNSNMPLGRADKYRGASVEVCLLSTV